MTLNPNIPLQVQGPDIATPVRNYADRMVQKEQIAKQDELRDLQILNERYNTLDNREKARINSVTMMAAELQPYLESGNAETALQALKARKRNLQSQMAQGLPVDTSETDQMIKILESGDIDTARQTVADQVSFGRMLGVLDDGGGDTANIRDFEYMQANPEFADYMQQQRARQPSGTEAVINQLMSENPKLSYAGALELLKGGAGQRGRHGADIDMGREANFETTMGKQEAEIDTVGDIAAEKARGAALAEAEISLADFEAMQPKLEQVVAQLDDLAETSTYTKIGQAYAFAQKELGNEVDQRDIDRAKYIAIVDNEVLPLLRQTFGAAFTVAEGEALRATLGDPNATPEQKKAKLDAFINNKRSMIEAQRRKVQRLGGEVEQPVQQPQRLRFNPETGDFE